MSLNQKYTWKDFLKENPQLKEKDVKRTSAEGKKAFEAAFKAKMKDVLKDRLVWIETEQKRATEKRDGTVVKMKATKKKTKRKVVQKEVGRLDKYLYRLEKKVEQTKLLQKSY